MVLTLAPNQLLTVVADMLPGIEAALLEAGYRRPGIDSMLQVWAEPPEKKR